MGLGAAACEKAAKSPSQRQLSLMRATELSEYSVDKAEAINGVGGRPSAFLKLSSGAYAAEMPLQRFIAERHNLEIITAEPELQKSWESVVAFCGSIRCEVVSSTITTRAGDAVPSGSVVLTEREDKTTAVVDTEAKIRNLTTFRDNLRAMLKKPSATVKDLVEIQQQLTETQSELDSETAQRKILANETEKIAVEISFRVESPIVHAGGFAQIWKALRESGSVLADSTASVIYTIFSIIPWLVLIVPGCWLVYRVWREVRRRRAATQAPAAAD